jgi:predicted MFS family arabinose efflux permease
MALAPAKILSPFQPQLRDSMAVLQSRNSILFFSGQSISLIGTWMAQATVLWMVYEYTHSAFSLGLITFLEQVPNFILVPITGGIIDRSDRRKILLTTQFLSLLHALALALMFFGNKVSIEALVVLSLIKGSINAFDITTRQVFIAEIAESKQELKSAIGLNALIISIARFIGPGLAGLVISQTNVGVCFAIDSCSYLVAIAALLLVRYVPISGRVVSPWQRFKAGWQYVWATPTLRSILILLSAMSFLGGSYPTLTPIFARETFLGGAAVMSYLLAAAGIGSLAGSLYLTFRPSHHPLDSILLLSTVGLGLGLIGFGQSRLFVLSLLMMFVIGLCLVLQAAICNILLQTSTLDRHRGVVMSLFTVAYIGMTPFGNLLVGRVAMLIGASSTLTIDGLLCLLGFSVVRSITRQLRGVPQS